MAFGEWVVGQGSGAEKSDSVWVVDAADVVELIGGVVSCKVFGPWLVVYGYAIRFGDEAKVSKIFAPVKRLESQHGARL